METPVHVRDQRQAAQHDALIHVLEKTGCKFAVIYFCYEGARTAQAAVNFKACENQTEVNNLVILGHLMSQRILEVSVDTLQVMFGSPAPTQDPPASTPDDLVNLVAKAADAIVRNCIAYGRLAPAGGWTDADLLTRVRSLATFAVNEEWRKKQ